jgi:hypothetical protein
MEGAENRAFFRQWSVFGRQAGHTVRSALETAGSLGKPEVEELGTAFREHDVVRFEVAVDDPLIVCRLESRRDLGSDFEDLFDREGALADSVAQGIALDQFHDKVVDFVLVADVKEGADIWVVERRDGPSLTLESPQELLIVGKARRQHLDGDLSIEAVIRGSPHLAHATGADLVDNPIVLQCLSGFEAHSVLLVVGMTGRLYRKSVAISRTHFDTRKIASGEFHCRGGTCPARLVRVLRMVEGGIDAALTAGQGVRASRGRSPLQPR